MHLELLTKQVANLSRVTGNFVKNEIRKIQLSDVETKGHNDFVTYVDKASERRLVRELGKLLPEAGFIAEENPELKAHDEYNWIIDPLDGTTNFIHGVPLYSISIALLHNKEIVLGVVFEVNLQECFYAWQNGGAFLNGHPISVSQTNNLKESLLATGFPYSDFGKMDAYIDLFKHLMKSSHGLRRLGSAAVDLAYVACGRYDGFYEYALHPWDVAAGSIIVEEAGGTVSDFKGSRSFLFGEEIIASNTKNYQELLAIVQQYF
ncbi:MAG: inositol monophosphatase family protein [Bacteroidales bacterium]